LGGIHKTKKNAQSVLARFCILSGMFSFKMSECRLKQTAIREFRSCTSLMLPDKHPTDVFQDANKAANIAGKSKKFGPAPKRQFFTEAKWLAQVSAQIDMKYVILSTDRKNIDWRPEHEFHTREVAEAKIEELLARRGNESAFKIVEAGSPEHRFACRRRKRLLRDNDRDRYATGDA
jgi:hypothetical protein